MGKRADRGSACAGAGSEGGLQPVGLEPIGQEIRLAGPNFADFLVNTNQD